MHELLRVLPVSDQRVPGVGGLDALRASRRVVEVFTGARWHLMRQAREEGASWGQIGQALGMSRQAAHDFYRRRLDEQEQGGETARSSTERA
jgi:hypothetical protein